MIINIKKKNSIEKEVKIKFAFIPLNTSTGQLIWLEKYYYYDDFRCVWRGRYSDFDSKVDFYSKIRSY